VITLEIKIVGAVTDENTLEEIENIAQIFAYERRMKDYTALLNTPKQKIEQKILTEKKLRKNSRFVQNTQHHVPVKGLW